MTPLEFTFDEPEFQPALEQLIQNERISAVQFLTLLEGEDEETFEQALQMLNDRRVLPELSDLPAPAADGEAAVRLRREQQLVKAGTLLTELAENDPLRLYLEELSAVPACGDVQVLGDRLASGDRTVTQQLTNLLLSRVVERACELTGRGVLLLDLIQEGSIGLWQGILSYTGGDIEEHCDWQIRWDLARAVMTAAREKGVGQKLRQAVEDYRAVDEQLLSELGRNPTLEEIAQRLHLSVDATAEVSKTMEAARIIARAKQPEQTEPTAEDEQAVEDTAYFQMRQRIEELLSDLDETDAKLLTLRFGLEGGKPLSPEEVGRQLGLTPEEAVAREAAALSKLRQR
jgi:RNA polymerase primary sigma factor